ncbi:MAG: AMP-binding protein [Burkholderiaceae bacterium]
MTPWPSDLAARYRAEGLWEGIGITEMVTRTAALFADKIAIVAGDRRISYGTLIAEVDTLAAAFLACGLRAGDRVVVQLPNIAEFVTVYLALNRIDAIPVMALRAHRHAEVRHFLRASGAVAYVIADVVGNFDFRTMAREMAAEFPTLAHVIVVGDPLPGQIALRTLIASFGSGTAHLDAVHVDPSGISTMLLSGGTTSMSKLIPRTHDDYVLNARLCGAAAGFGSDTVFMAILPLGHNYNLASPGILGTFYYGGTVVIAPSPDTDVLFTLVARERVTVIAAAVPLITTWLNDDVAARHDLSSLEVVQNGGARLPPELRSRLRARFGCTPQEIYGTAEGLINMTRLDDPDDVLLESSGSPVSAWDEVKVVDDLGQEVPDGSSGELLTRGPYTIRGYWSADESGAAEKNREAFTVDGWYRMGDIVRKRGRQIYTEGRRKDLINRGGEKISCEEIENLIFAHPKVRTVVLVAMPDPVFGEKACACVIVKPGETLSFDELTGFLRDRQIASFKLPERLEVMDAFPVSPVGKIMKRELRDLIAAKLASAQAVRAS